MKFFKKHEMLIAISLIIIYVILNSYCAQNFGETDYRTVICDFTFALIIISVGFLEEIIVCGHVL